MTAFREYERLEATGLWRATPEAQRREVLVSVGEATLTISDFQGRALTHWSLAAILRKNPGRMPAIPGILESATHQRDTDFFGFLREAAIWKIVQQLVELTTGEWLAIQAIQATAVIK